MHLWYIHIYLLVGINNNRVFRSLFILKGGSVKVTLNKINNAFLKYCQLIMTEKRIWVKTKSTGSNKDLSIFDPNTCTNRHVDQLRARKLKCLLPRKQSNWVCIIVYIYISKSLLKMHGMAWWSVKTVEVFFFITKKTVEVDPFVFSHQARVLAVCALVHILAFVELQKAKSTFSRTVTIVLIFFFALLCARFNHNRREALVCRPGRVETCREWMTAAIEAKFWPMFGYHQIKIAQ